MLLSNPRMLAFLSLLSMTHHPYAAPSRRSLEDFNSVNDVLVLDAPAFQDGSSMKASIQAFVSLRPISLSPIVKAFSSALENLGLVIGDKLENLEERVRLFGAVGLEGKQVKLRIDGCDGEAIIRGTSGFPDLGMMLKTVDIGSSCGTSLQGNDEVNAKVELAPTDKRDISTTIFPSSSDGFGVISGEQVKYHCFHHKVLTRERTDFFLKDIDDTIKISHTLNKLQLLQSTFLDDPQPVPGMPELYKSLQQSPSLSNPPFFYISGSPFQLYPFLHTFIHDTYPHGPLFLQNLTFVDIKGVMNFMSLNGTLEYKTLMNERIHGFFPKKAFLAIGDSTQKDPEAYATSYVPPPSPWLYILF